jgi:hypothetical protein
MRGLTISIDRIGNSPPVVRYWLEQEFTWVFDHRPGNNRSTDAAASEERIEPDPRAKGSRRAESRVDGTSIQAPTAGPTRIDPSAQGAALRKLIAERAYELWENQGKPHGCDLIHWREAEQEIMDCLGPTKMDSARGPAGVAS